MRISKLYSNQPDKFQPIEFRRGLNVIIAEIRLPENKQKDTHNLGKTTLGRLLDFCFLSKRDSKFFLFKHQDVFDSFVFFLELELSSDSFVTIRRSVEEATKISFKRHTTPHPDLSDAPIEDWDHQQVPFERAKTILDGLLNWQAIKPWPFRNILGYLIRSQDDFRDIFQLRRFVTQADWKPPLAHTLGFTAKYSLEHYAKEQQLAKLTSRTQALKSELGDSTEKLGKLEGIILLKQRESEKKQRLLESFDFRATDREITKAVVGEIDERIAELNAERYSLEFNKNKVLKSLQEDQILFDPEAAKQLFEESGVVFAGQIKKDFQQLIAFNRAITAERSSYLEEELRDIESRIKYVNTELNTLGKRRAEMLSFLRETDIFDKYKRASDQVVNLRASIASLERQRHSLQRVQELRTEIRTLNDESRTLISQIEKDVEEQNSNPQSLFSTIRLYFSEIVEEVIDRKALLSVSTNQSGHLEFSADILDESGNATSANLGHTYRKLLCIAFDMAILRAHLGDTYPRFVYHDGVFESLDDRKKENLLGVIRRHADMGLQPIITLIDSDLPVRVDGEISLFDPTEIRLTLHDQDDSGRLFKMREW